VKKKSTSKPIQSTKECDNPEWTREDFRRAVPFSALPAKLQEKLRNIMRKSGQDKD